MKALLVKSILIIGIALGLTNYMVYLNSGAMLIDGLPSITTSSILPDKLLPSKADLTDMVNTLPSELISNLQDDHPTQHTPDEGVYRWTDASGKIHYSSEPPTDSTSTTFVAIDPDSNIVKNMGMTTNDEKPKKMVKSATSNTQAYRPSNIDRLINEVRDVQNLMDGRLQQIDAATENATR